MNKITISIGNENIENIIQGCSLIERKDEELDEFQAIAIFSKNFDPYPSGTLAIVQINENDTYYYAIASDSIELFSKNPKTYKHTLVLKEETVLLENKVNDSLSFTNPKPFIDCLNRYRNCTPVEREDCFDSTRLFEIDSAMNPDVKNRIIPETKLNYGTVKDQLVSLFAMVDAYPRLENHVLKADEFNKKRNLITNATNIIDEKSANSILEQKSSVHVFLENAIPNIETQSPSMCDCMTSRTEDAVFNTANGALILEYPIEKILKVEIVMQFQRNGNYYPTKEISSHSEMKNFILSSSADGKTYYYHDTEYQPYFKNNPPILNVVYEDSNNRIKVSVDITDKVLLSDEWNTLPVGSSKSENTKNNTLHYSVGDYAILGVGDSNSYQNLIFGHQELVLNELFENTLYESIEIKNEKEGANKDDPMYLRPEQMDNINNALFRVTYIPQFNCHLKLQKNNDGNEMIVNQGSDKVDVEKIGYSLSGLIRRLGPAEKTLIRIFSSFNDVNHVGDYLEDNYILTAVQHIIYNNYVMSIENYNKNFNRKSIYTGIDQSTRTFATTATSIVRQINYSEYVVVSFTENKYSDQKQSLITESGKALFKSFFTKEIDFPAEVVSFIEHSPYTLDIQSQIILPLIKSSFGNSMLFNFKFKDKTSVGNKKVKYDGDTYYRMEPVIYTKEDGSLDYLSFDFQRTNILFKNKYAITNDFTSNNSEYILASDGNFYKKIELIKSQDATSNPITAYAKLDAINVKFEGTYFNTDESIGERMKSMADGLPKLDANYYGTFESLFSMNDSQKLSIFKDVSEIPSITYQLHVVSDDPNIIIGDYFAKYNHLICKKRPRFLVYPSQERYEKYETSKCKGNYDGNCSIEEDSNGIRITFNPMISLDLHSLAIGDENGNLVLAINTEISRSIYFNFLNKLPDSI